MSRAQDMTSKGVFSSGEFGIFLLVLVVVIVGLIFKGALPASLPVAKRVEQLEIRLKGIGYRLDDLDQRLMVYSDIVVEITRAVKAIDCQGCRLLDEESAANGETYPGVKLSLTENE